MLSRQRGTDSLNVLGEGARGAPAASDVSIIPGWDRDTVAGTVGARVRGAMPCY